MMIMIEKLFSCLFNVFVHRFNRLYPRVITDLPVVSTLSSFFATPFYFMRVLKYQKMYIQSLVEMV